MALQWYWISLVLNFFWPIIFFLLEAYLYALIWIIILLAVLLICLYHFYQMNQWAFYLWIPYVLWVAFAAYLNYGIYRLN